MKLSGEKRNNLYGAISGNIIDLRVMNQRAIKEGESLDFDQLLFDLEIDIWHEVVKALNLSHP